MYATVIVKLYGVTGVQDQFTQSVLESKAGIRAISSKNGCRTFTSIFPFKGILIF